MTLKKDEKIFRYYQRIFLLTYILLSHTEKVKLNSKYHWIMFSEGKMSIINLSNLNKGKWIIIKNLKGSVN